MLNIPKLQRSKLPSLIAGIFPGRVLSVTDLLVMVSKMSNIERDTLPPNGPECPILSSQIKCPDQKMDKSIAAELFLLERLDFMYVIYSGRMQKCAAFFFAT